MILKSKEFKEVCSSILAATDSNALSEITETLELVTEGKVLYLNVTNGEYYASRRFELDHEEELHATVKADTFLKLIDKITTEDVELQLFDNYILVKANGNYKLPLVMENDHLLTLPQITIENKTVEMNIPYSVLETIAAYNSKSIADSSLAKAIQKLYYIDEKGCMTAANTACVNTFTLEKPVKFLLNDRIVKLFKLFKGSTSVKFELGYDAVSETIVQTKVSFTNDFIKLTAILSCNDALLKQVKVDQVRALADMTYPNIVVLNKNLVLEAVNRLILFNDAKAVKTYTKFNFDVTGNLTIYDMHDENCEVLKYQKGTEIEGPYTMTLDIVKFAKVLETCSEEFVTLNFGNHQACVISRLGIRNIIREVI